MKSPFNIICLARVFCLLISALVFAPQIQARPEPPVLEAEKSFIRVKGDQVEYVVETSPWDHLQVSASDFQGQWQTLPGKNILLDAPPGPVWFRLKISHKSVKDEPWLLRIENPGLSRIEVFQYDPADDSWATKQVSGNNVYLEERALAHRNYLFPLNLRPDEPVWLYLRVETPYRLYLPLELWPARSFWKINQHQVLMLGLLFGALTIMLFYNLSLYFSVRDKSYFYYTVYVLFIILYLLALTGFGTQYLWDRAEWIKIRSLPLFAFGSFLTAALFVRHFLSLKKYGGWVLHLNSFIVVYWLLAVVSCAFQLNITVLKTSEAAAFLSGVAGLVTGIYLWARGNSSAKYFTIAWSFLMLSTIFLSLTMLEIIEPTPLATYAQLTGFVLQVILLSFALGQRIGQERTEREQAQEMALELSHKVAQERDEKLKAQEHLLAMQRRSNEELELKVLDRTDELQRAMKNLEIANEELSKLSFIDPLTKIHNRRYFEEVMASEVKRASRINQPLSVIIADLDHFKQINDTFGHLIGDECLRLAARAMSHEMWRTGDLLARYGGEEFALVLPATSPEKALIVADRTRKAVENITFIQRGQRISLNISLGVAGWVPEQNESPSLLISKADEALYLAKNSGRNRVVAA